MKGEGQRPEPGETEEAWTAGAFALLAIFVPVIMLGWALGPMLATRRHAWRARTGLNLWALTAIAAVGLGGCLLAREALQQLAWPTGWGTIVVLVVLWAAQVPVGMTAAVWRMDRQATDLARGRLHPERSDHVRRAIWNGAALVLPAHGSG